MNQHLYFMEKYESKKIICLSAFDCVLNYWLYQEALGEGGTMERLLHLENLSAVFGSLISSTTGDGDCSFQPSVEGECTRV